VVLGRGGRLRGADLAFQAIALTIFVLAGNTLLRPLVNALNRAPISERSTEATYEVRVTTDSDHIDQARDLIETQLEAANHPVRRIDVIARETDTVELVATLVATTADPAELDKVIARLNEAPFVEHASWTVRTPD
jgi:putative Mg2+ transporter-C (MgtC) family protein